MSVASYLPITNGLRRCAVVPLAIALLTSCGPSGMAHLDGHPFAPVREIRLRGGWVAVDSCTVGIHAMVELELPASERPRIDHVLADIGAALDRYRVRHPREVQISGPYCWPQGPGVVGRPERRDADPTLVSHDRPCTPTLLVRAEYDLFKVPQAGTPITVTQDNRRITLKWIQR